jgi:hypothetical protein
MTLAQSKIVDAIFDSGGRLSVAAKQIGCSLKTLYNHRDRDADVAAAITEARACLDCEILDVAECKLLEAVKAGDWCAIKYVLSTKGKSRGYTDRVEVDQVDQYKQIIMHMNVAPDIDEAGVDAN